MVSLIPERPGSSISRTSESMLVPVAVNAFASDSVEGQLARPSEVMRLVLLKVVGSSPDFLARPDGESPARAARRSRAVQIWVCVSMGFGPPLPRNFVEVRESQRLAAHEPRALKGRRAISTRDRHRRVLDAARSRRD